MDTLSHSVSDYMCLLLYSRKCIQCKHFYGQGNYLYCSSILCTCRHFPGDFPLLLSPWLPVMHSICLMVFRLSSVLVLLHAHTHKLG